MKKAPLLLYFLLVSFLTFIILSGCERSMEKEVDALSISPSPQPLTSSPKKQVVLTMGSWRMDDVEQINDLLKKFNQKYPHIIIKFDPTYPSEYNEVITAQLEGGTAPDLFYLRSFSSSRKMYTKGYLHPLETLPGLKENFPENMRSAWSTEDGLPYGVPLMAVSHGIYYNKSIFKKLNISIPGTWEDLISIAKHLKQRGIIPFANASGDDWTISGMILHQVIPNIIGGEKGRLEYYSGLRCFNDLEMQEAYQAVADISTFLSPNHQQLKYADSLQLFLQEKAAMWFGGSWDIPFIESQQLPLQWSIFPTPPPKGKEFVISFHPDAGIGLNSDSQYKKEALTFLEWMTTEEFSQTFGNLLPGFFPLHHSAPQIKNEFANTFLDFNRQYKKDLRFAWGKIRDHQPSAYTLTLNTARDVINQEISAKEAANRLQKGLEKWYQPAMHCNQ